MKTVLQINSVINWGSTGRIAEGIGQVAMDSGWRSYIAFSRYGGNSRSELLKIGNAWDVRWHGLQTRLFDRHGLASYEATRKLIGQIRQITPDLIHLHNIHGYYLNFPLLFRFLKEEEIPVVWTLHDCWPFTGHCAHFEYEGCLRWQSGCYDCPLKRYYPGSLLFDRSEKNYRQKKECFTALSNLTLVPVSEWLARKLPDSFFKGCPVQVIYNGVDTTVFKPENHVNVREKYGIGKHFMILGVASIWGERKGLDDFVKLQEKIGKDGVIVLVGVSNEQARRLPEGIIAISRTDDVEELAGLYATADVFVNPTWEDNFPTTNLEALASGTPVITYCTGGSVEAVTPETGVIVEQGDILSLADEVRKIRRSGKSKYADACRQHALRYFRQEERFAEYIVLYEKITAGRNAHK